MTPCRYPDPMTGRRCGIEEPHRHIYEWSENGPSWWVEPQLFSPEAVSR